MAEDKYVFHDDIEMYLTLRRKTSDLQLHSFDLDVYLTFRSVLMIASRS